VVADETNTWTGSSNTTWSVRQNWSLDRSPVDSDFIVIPSPVSRYPVLDAARTVNGLEIRSGASLALGGYNLTVASNATVAGSLRGSGTETITFNGNAVVSGALTAVGTETFLFHGNANLAGGSFTAACATITFERDVSFTGGSFTTARSTVLLPGSGAQTVNLGNLTFYKIVVLNKGYVEQVGHPLDLYHSPASLFVAGFIGSPQMNFINGEFAGRYDATTLGIRPEHLSVETDGPIKGTLKHAEKLGNETFAYVNAGDLGDVTARVDGTLALEPGNAITLGFAQEHLYRFDSQGQRL